MNAFQHLAATNRPAFNQARKGLQAENRKMPVTMTKQEHTPKDEKEPHGVWRSSDFLCCAYLQGLNLRLSVCRTEIDNKGNWREDITWEDLQRIKRECGYGNHWAVEIFPADEHLVNVASMRHMWIVECPPFAWVKHPETHEEQPEPIEEVPDTIATHYAPHCEEAPWIAVNMTKACKMLEGYNLTEQEKTELPWLMAGYCRLLDEAEMVFYGMTQDEAIAACRGIQPEPFPAVE